MTRKTHTETHNITLNRWQTVQNWFKSENGYRFQCFVHTISLERIFIVHHHEASETTTTNITRTQNWKRWWWRRREETNTWMANELFNRNTLYGISFQLVNFYSFSASSFADWLTQRVTLCVLSNLWCAHIASSLVVFLLNEGISSNELISSNTYLYDSYIDILCATIVSCAKDSSISNCSNGSLVVFSTNKRTNK